MASRMLAPNEILATGQTYRAWVVGNARNAAGERFRDELEEKGLQQESAPVPGAAGSWWLTFSVVDRWFRSDDMGAADAKRHIAWAWGAATNLATDPAQVMLYTDPGFIERAADAVNATNARIAAGAGAVVQDARDAAAAVRDAGAGLQEAPGAFARAFADLGSTLRTIAIAVPVTAALGAGIYLLVVWRQGKKKS